MKDFESVGRLIRNGRFTKDRLLDGMESGEIKFAVDAYGFFAWSAHRTVGEHYKYSAPGRLCGRKEHLFVAPRYIGKFLAGSNVGMGVFRVSRDSEDIVHVRLDSDPESNKKPILSFKGLFVDAESLAKLDGKDYQPDSPAHILALLIQNDMLKNHKEHPEIFPHPDNCGEGRIYRYLADDNVSGEYKINDDSREVAEVAKKKSLRGLVVRYHHEDVTDPVPFTKLMEAFKEIRGR